MDIQEPQSAPAAEAKPEQHPFRFPPIVDKTLCFQLPSGDVWMGFNPAKFPLRVVLAWAAFEVEQYFAQFVALVRAAEEKANQPKQKKSMLQILGGK